MPRETILFLDVDGVVNALSSRHGFGDGRRSMVDGYKLHLSRQLGRRLRELDAEIRWLTTWADRANEVGSLMGLPELSVAAMPPEGATASDRWKFEVVKTQVERERRAFIWIDDDAIGIEAEVWANQCGVRGLLLRPKPNRGLTPSDLDVVEEFIGRG